ncbi:anti-sigma factor family protein [Alicyclobacillus sacchari]|nr:zf-HC2 domain-containing protein [Alicyclobacillus sacchari]
MANRFCELCSLYALGGLAEEEVIPFERHLATCPDCQEELASLRAVTDVLSLDFDFVSPPPGMRERVLTAVFAHQPESRSRSEVTGETQRIDVDVSTLPRDQEPLSAPKQLAPTANASSRRRRQSLIWWAVSWASLVAIAGG